MKIRRFRPKSRKYRVKDASKIEWSRLSNDQKHFRTLSLKVLANMRDGKSLMKSSREFGIDPRTVKGHIKSGIRKSRSRWRPRKMDRIERALVINENGRSKTIIVSDSTQATIIGQYHNAVKTFLETGDISLLKPFKKIIITDSKGRKHRLETRPNKLFEIHEAREDSEFFEIYGD